MKEFKAGDFTSGKMGEIFRECFIKDGVVISHKQFGKAYLIPEDIIHAIVLFKLEKNAEFNEFASFRDSKDGTFKDYLSLESDLQMRVIQAYFSNDFEYWFDVLIFLYAQI